MPAEEDAISEVTQSTLDIAWCACDLDGHIAFFTSGGVGKLPRAVIASNAARILVLEFFEKMPASTRCVRRQEIREFKEISPKHYFRDYDFMGTRGLYAYDAQLHHHSTEPYVPYQLVVEPTIPCEIEILPKDVRDLISSVRFPLRFAKTPIIPHQMVD